MANSEHASGLGPVVFFGLSIYMLVMGSPIEPEYLNPSETMDMAQVAHGVVQRAAVAPFPDVAPRENPPGAPLVAALPELGPVAGEERVALASRPASVPEVFGAPGALPLAQAAGVVAASNAGLTTPFPDPDPKHAAHADLPGFVFEQRTRTQGPAALPRVSAVIGPLARPAVPESHESHESHEGAAVSMSPPAVSKTPRSFAPAGPDQRFFSAQHEPVQVIANAVNLRIGPDISFTSIAKMYRGARGVRVATRGDWSLLQIYNQGAPVSGWMASEFLTPLAAR